MLYLVEIVFFFSFAIIMNFLVSCIIDNLKFIAWPFCIFFTIMMTVFFLLPFHMGIPFGPLHAFAMTIVGGIIGKIYFKGNIKTSLIVASIITLLFLISNTLASFIFVLIHHLPITIISEDQLLRIQLHFFMLIIFAIIALIVFYFRILKLKTFVGAKINLMFLAYIIIMLIGFSIMMSGFIRIENYLAQISIWSLVFIPNVIFLLWTIEYMRKQAERQQDFLYNTLQNDHFRKRIHQLTDSNEQIKRMHHDFKHQVNLLRALDANGNSNELSRYLNELATTKADMTLVFTGDATLDALLSSKKQESLLKGIDFEMALAVEPELPYLSLDICVLLSNALDNASEAAGKCAPGTKKIKLELTAKQTEFTFYICNTLNEVPKLDHKSKQLLTNKRETFYHGIGLKSMEQTCKDLNGKMTYEFNESLFKLWIVLSV